ncbi:MAG TPA: CDP-diacylglycerol--serine O-phosphatidyltransferase [Polyangia bacterium]|jgi:CDP-diacylglycerol--serine O-phosphatidyltransferase
MEEREREQERLTVFEDREGRDAGARRGFPMGVGSSSTVNVAMATREGARSPGNISSAVKLKHVIPNAITLANISCGFLGILAAAAGQFQRAVMFLFVGALFDLADGRVARLLGATSNFGKELDSLSDMVSFGVAPAVLVYLAVLERLGLPGLILAMIFPLAGAVRLARYNIDTKELSHVTFEGLPIPIAASYVWSFVMVRDALPVWLIGAGVLLAAALMVSTLKIPKFRRGGLPVPLMFVGVAAFTAFLAHPTALTWHLWNGFNVVLLGLNYALLSRQGLLPGRGGASVRANRAT